METQALQTTQQSSLVPADVSLLALEKAVGMGDVSALSPDQRLRYIANICQSTGLNAVTLPIRIIKMDGRDTLYATSEAGAQLRNKHKISIRIKERKEEHNCYIVVAEATDPAGKVDEATGAVPLVYPEKTAEWRNGQKVYIAHPKAGQHVEGLEYANAIKKAETQAKRRVALSICGLGIPDESELDDMRQARVSAVETIHSAVEDSAAARAEKLNAQLSSKLEVVETEVISDHRRESQTTLTPVTGAGSADAGQRTASVAPFNLDSAPEVAQAAKPDGHSAAIEQPLGESNRSAAFYSPEPLAPAPTAPPQTVASPQPVPSTSAPAAVLSEEEERQLEAALMACPQPARAHKYLIYRGWLKLNQPLREMPRREFTQITTKTPVFVRMVEGWKGDL